MIHFDGCGAGFPYSIGYAMYLKKHYDLTENLSFSGVSSGALIATALALDLDLHKPIDLAFHYQKSLQHRRLGLLGVWKKILHPFYNALLPDQMLYSAIKTLHIRLTYTNLASEFISDFTSKQDLTHCLLASQHIPFLLDMKPWTEYRGRHCLDGQWIDKKTTLTSPNILFVRPQKWNPLHSRVSLMDSFRFKTWEKVDNLLQKGYQDAFEHRDKFSFLALKQEADY